MNLRKLAEQHGLEFIEKPNGHVQVKGALLVNYYPESKQRTAYIAGTRKGFKYATPEKVIELATSKPPISPNIKKRKIQTKRKMKLLRKYKNCHWCNKELMFKTATVDHVIPLYRGGLDNDNNTVLSCQPCNEARGHDMPEIKTINHPED